MHLTPGQNASRSLDNYLAEGPRDSGLSPEELLASAQAFTPLAGSPAWGFSSQTHWLSFTLASHFSEPKDWWLQVDPVFTDRLSLYWTDEQGRLQQLQAGDLLSPDQRPLDLPQQVFPLTLQPGEQRTFLLQVAGTNPLFADLTLRDRDAFLEASQKRHFYWSAYLGVLALMALLGLVYSNILRDRSYSFYTLYVLTQLVFQLAHSGYLAWLLPLPWSRLPDWLTSASVSLSLIFFACLLVRLTAMSRDFPAMARCFLLLTGGMSATGLLLTFADHYQWVASWIQVYILLLTAFAVVFSIYRLVTGEIRLGSAYLLVFGVLALGVTLRILREQSWLPNNFWTENAIYLGTLVHLLAMQLMILETIARNQRLNAQELEVRVFTRTQELQERNQQLLASHQKNLQLQSDLSKSLKQESRIRKAQQDFLCRMANEFATPLTVIDGALTLFAIQGEADIKIRRGWLEKIRGAQQDLVALVNTSIWDQRLADADWHPSNHSLDFLPWMLQLTENLRRMYNNRYLVLLGSKACEVETDPEILQMLLQNLVGVLVARLPADTEITLNYQADEAKLLLTVSTPSQALAVDVTARSQQEHKTDGKLHLAKAAACKLGGSLEYKSDHQDAGFILTLPKNPRRRLSND